MAAFSKLFYVCKSRYVPRDYIGRYNLVHGLISYPAFGKVLVLFVLFHFVNIFAHLLHLLLIYENEGEGLGLLQDDIILRHLFHSLEQIITASVSRMLIEDAYE